MELQKLLTLHVQGALNIKSDNPNIAVLGDTQINAEQAVAVVGNIGWTEYYLHPFEIINKTNKFIKGIKNHITRENFWETGHISFQNKRAAAYGKTFDRIVIQADGLALTIIYNMESAGAKYAVYETGKPLIIGKCRNLKAVAEFINAYES